MIELDDIAAVVAETVREATAPLIARISDLEQRELVLPEKGEPGERGETGANGNDGRDGADGKDGIGLADALIDSDGALVLTMTDGRTKTLGRVNGKDGTDGQDGHTFTLDDFDIESLDERTLKFKFTKGEVCHSFEFAFPVVLDRGVFKAGQEYEQGDAVSWGGSLWIAQRSTGDKPDGPDSGWRLAVKKGRDGKDMKG